MKNIVFKIVLLVSIALRVILMSNTIHPDFRAVNFAGFLIAQKGEVFSFYDFIRKLPRNDYRVNLYGDDLFIYPPLAYLSHGLANLLLSPFYPSNAFDTLLVDVGSLRQVSNYQGFIFLLKLPYLIVDFLCLWFIRKLVSNDKKNFISLIWLFNPVNLYVTYMIGQFDIFICLFLILSLVYPKLSGIWIGIAAGFKPFPLFLLPLLPGSKIKNLFLGIVTYGIIIAPYLPSQGFRQYALVASLSDKIQYAKVMVSGSQYLSIFFVALIFIYALHATKEKIFSNTIWLALPFLLFYSVTHFHPQWFIWASPFFALVWVKFVQARLYILGLLLFYAVIVLSFDTSLHLGLFGLNGDPLSIAYKYYPKDELISLVRSAFAATSLGLLLVVRGER